jgi:aryl-alcohol dehydrogenase-like predicted oxidoreductase
MIQPYNTEIEVSKICLGTMTLVNKIRRQKDMNKWIMHLKGVNFGTQPRCILFLHVRKPGDTERIIGTWFKKTGRREEVVLASKIAGPNPNFTYMREKNDFSASIKYALDNSTATSNGLP